MANDEHGEEVRQAMAERPTWAHELSPHDDLLALIHQTPGATAEGLWEDYEENFADNPFNAFYCELARLVAHTLGLKHQLTPDQQDHIMRLWTFVNIDLPGEPVLLDYEPVAKHYDADSTALWLNRVGAMIDDLQTFHRHVEAEVERA